MKFIYSKCTSGLLIDEQRLEKLFSLFSYVLLQTSGDVNEALDWLSQLDEKYSLFGENMTFNEFIEKLKENGKAYYSSLNELGEQVFVDYIRSKQKPGFD